MEKENIIDFGIYVPVDLLEDRLKAEAYNQGYLNFKIHKIKSGIPYLPLSEFMTISAMIGWKGLTTEHYVDKGGYYLIRTVDLDNFFINLTNALRVDEEKVVEQPQIILKEADIVISKDGTLGELAIVENLKDAKLCAASTLARLRKKSDSNIDNHFVLVCLASKEVKGQIYSFTSGIAQPHLNQEYLKKIEIPIPSEEIQKYIGDKVRKAEKLRNEYQMLKDTCNSLLSKYLGEPSLKADRTSLSLIKSSELTDRIDAEYYRQTYLEIINALKAKYDLISLDKICNGKISNGKTYQTTQGGSLLQNIGVGELGNWFPETNVDKCINEKVASKNILPFGSIVWGNAAHLAKYIGQKVNIILEENRYVGTTEITSILPDENIMSPYFVFLFMNSDWGYYQIQRTVKGMTAHSYPDDIRNILVPNISFTQEELQEIKTGIINAHSSLKSLQECINSAKKDIEDLIEGSFRTKEEYLNLID